MSSRFGRAGGFERGLAALAGAAWLSGSAGASIDGTASPRAVALQFKATSVLPRSQDSLLAPGVTFAGERRYVLQIDGPMTPARQDALQRAGVVLEDYVPSHSYIVTLDGVDAGALGALGFVVWVGEFRPEWKIDPELGVRRHTTPARTALAAAGTAQVVVVSFDGFDAKPIADEIARLGGAAFDVNPCGKQWMIDARLPVAKAAALATLPGVQYIEDAPEGTFRNDSNRWIVQSNATNQTPIWDKGIHGEAQMAGHIDGTINESHCSFDDSVPVGPTHRKIVAMRNAAAIDGHGTHTAGTFVGDQNPFGTYTTNDGIAYAAKLSFSNVDSIYNTPSTLNPRLTDAHNDGARVHSNSWGDDGTTAYTTWCRQIDVFTYNHEDDVVAFAVSNGSTVTTPENALNVLAVGASGDTPLQNSHCYGGSGPTSDGRRKPEVYAPGCNTTSSDSGSSCGFVSSGWSGTSMASPVVAGSGLLARQYFTEGWYPSGTKTPADAFIPTGALIRAVLINSAVDMTGISGYPSNSEGWGRLKLNNTMVFAGGTRKLWVADVRNADGLSTGQQTDYAVIVNSNSTPLNVTLVSTDPAASVGSTNPVVNNLDLQVMAPANNLYLGNYFSGGQSVIGGSPDAKNNVEQVMRSSPTPGVYIVSVKGTAVNGGTGSPFRQGYAVVVTGDIAPCAAPAITDQPDPLTVYRGHAATFTVAASGTDTLTYQWQKGGVPIGGATSPSYTIPAVDFADAAPYSVVVTNPCGDVTSADAPLTVLCPSDFDGNTFVNGDDFDAFVEAFVAGDPAADFDGNTFVNGDDFDAFVEAFAEGC